MFSTNKTEEKSLEIHWSHFHLGLLQGVFMSLPVVPDHANAISRVRAIMIHAIQVGIVTAIVPPGSVIPPGTVFAKAIIILISS